LGVGVYFDEDALLVIEWYRGIPLKMDEKTSVYSTC